jgi:cell division protein FtsB
MAATVPYEQLTDSQLVGILRARDKDITELTSSNSILMEKMAQIQNILDRFLDRHDSVEASMKKLRDGGLASEVKVATLAERVRNAEYERDTVKTSNRQIEDRCRVLEKEVGELKREREVLLDEIKYHQTHSSTTSSQPPPPHHAPPPGNSQMQPATVSTSLSSSTFRFLGLQVRDASEGVVVEKVMSPATSVGLREGDVLRFAAVHKEYPLRNVADYKELVTELMAGSSVAIEGWRRGKDGSSRPVEYAPFTPSIGQL